MQYVVQLEEVDISDGCEAVNVWDLDCSESLARARKLAKGIIVTCLPVITLVLGILFEKS